METIKKAKDQFDSGLNCAQSVLSSFSEEMNFDETLALDITNGFGAGMGKLQQTCGAVTGAYMVLGVYCSKLYQDRQEAKLKTEEMVRAFEQRFKMIHGTTQCKDLIQVDLKTEKGKQKFKEDNIKEKICHPCVAHSVEILKGLMV